MQTLPLSVRDIRATEARLEAIYEAAKLGLKGDSLALAAGMLPVEYRRLCELDPLAATAALKGRADAEMELSKVRYQAAVSGDSKAALAVLQHRHDWTARQEVSVDVTNRISILSAIEQANNRVIEGGAAPLAPLEHHSAHQLTPAHAEAEVHR